MLIADARRHRYRNDAAQYRSPEGIDERLVAGEQEDQLVARPRPELLQVVEDAERTLVQCPEGNRAGVALALEVSDAARGAAVGLHQRGQRCRIHVSV